MFALHTVLCPVDFSAATPRQVDIAADLCRAFSARLILHHNKHSLGTGASIGWMWNADHHGEPQASLEEKLRECLARVPEGAKAEAHITEGPVSRAVLAMSESFGAELIVLTTHGTFAEDHASITMQMVERSNRDVLVLHEPRVESRTPRFASSSKDLQVMVVPTDLTPDSRVALDLAFDLARTLPIELHLLQVGNGRGRRGEEEPSAQLQALVPKDLAERTKLHLEHGAHADRIAMLADELSASCIVMGELAQTPLRRWFSGDASRAVLHQAHCPVWHVPRTRASAPQLKEFSGVGRL
jgi:nucleotide-binding universal stress UspA family protein